VQKYGASTQRQGRSITKLDIAALVLRMAENPDWGLRVFVAVSLACLRSSGAVRHRGHPRLEWTQSCNVPPIAGPGVIEGRNRRANTLDQPSGLASSAIGRASSKLHEADKLAIEMYKS
jgi:hypothetical protein